MTAVAALVKPYLKKLVLQTHPDFFHGDPLKGKRNAASLQQLYTILNPLLKNEQREKKLKKEQSVQLEFYGKKARKTRIVSTFESSTNNNEWQTAASLLGLCKQLDIDVATSDMQAVQDMTQKQAAANEATAMHKKRGGLREEFARALHKQHTMAGTAAAAARRLPWSPNLILGNRLLTFGPRVDKHAVAQQWTGCMAKLEPERWWGILPVLVVATQEDGQRLAHSERGRGILIFSSDMGCSDFITGLEMKAYLEANLETKRNERISMSNHGNSNSNRR
ncbi:hypothetical protein BDB00DRAFT_934472 [Zychaea mexicana]|uniref:uncharacterized protein n=1 Tax=Zychaea mexicana TaxID=64656 RepID=UPI0022FDF677|nr:uncharacterized protein BDB00DRAFT_934472 [Zychaea mexicana]KAI9469313.1 hypothetical protein BDB00DRAFT_934472 [Zychaea mexicana]